MNLNISFIPKFSKDNIDMTKLNAYISNEETTLNISSLDIKFNELYLATVRVNGADMFMYNISE